MLVVLRALSEEGGRSTAAAICSRARISRSTLDQSLRALVRSGLVHKGRRTFGGFMPLLLSDRGTKALRLAVILESLLSENQPSPDRARIFRSTQVHAHR